MANAAVTGIGAAVSSSSLTDTANGIKDLETALETAEESVENANNAFVCPPALTDSCKCQSHGTFICYVINSLILLDLSHFVINRKLIG